MDGPMLAAALRTSSGRRLAQAQPWLPCVLLLSLRLHCEPHLHLHSLATRHVAAESSQPPHLLYGPPFAW
jgi:hypothetical protein